MARKPYRIELNYSHAIPYYYLVKDVKIKGRRTKARIYLGHTQPSAEDLENYRKIHAYDLEVKAAQKKAEMSATVYTPRYLDSGQIITIEAIRWLYKTFASLLTTSEIDVYERAFEVNYVQGTTSIEGNTLTTKQTEDLLVNNIPPNDKSLREINEVQNFKNVKTYRDSYRHKRITLDFIKTLHSLIMSNIDYESAGVFRRIDVTIAGCDLQVTPAILIREELSNLIDEYYTQLEEGMHPFEATVMFHYKFEMIHPFLDGNGRVGREIINHMLKKCGYPRLLFLGEERETYIKSLKMGNEDQYAAMIQVFADLITKQRYDVLMEKLKDIVVPAKDSRQLRLDQFYL